MPCAMQLSAASTQLVSQARMLRAKQSVHVLSWRIWWAQMQALASGFGTVLGTVVRIPCEVLKQRLQVSV